MSNLYENERAYCFLSEAEQAELAAEYEAGRVLFMGHGLGWYPKPNFVFNPYTVYRITKPELTKPSIDWDHVDDWVTCMATDQIGRHQFFESRPVKDTWGWVSDGRIEMVEAFKSFRPGTCDWKDSLVMKPGVGK
jgi:hypothetical protein